MATDVEDSEMEGSPEFKHALKMVLKRQMKDLINQICEQGIEIAVMEVNINDGSTSHFGTPIGESFIAEQKSLTHSFASFCKTNGRISSDVPSDRSPRRRVEKKITPMSKSRPSTSTDPPTLRITVPRRLSVGISEQELGGLVGRIVASQLDKNKEKGDGSSGGTKFDALLESVKAKEKPLNVTRSGRKVSNKFLEGLKSSKKSIKAEESESGDEGSSEKLIGRLSDLETQAMKKVQVKTGDGKSVDVQKTTLVQGDQLESLAAAIIKELQRVPNIADRKQVKVTVSILEEDTVEDEITIVTGDETSTVSEAVVDSIADELEDEVDDEPMDDSETELLDHVKLFSEPGASNNKADGVEREAFEDLADENGDQSSFAENDVDANPDNPLQESLGRKKGRKRGRSQKEIPAQCEYCGQQLLNKYNLDLHIRRMHFLERNFPCMICSRRFWNTHRLNSHILSIHTRRCEQCKQYVIESEPWPEGMDRTKNRKVPCKCGGLVSMNQAKYLMEKEERENSKASQKTYACGECGRLFWYKWECKKHRASHTTENQVTCEFCKKDFCNKSSLMKHLEAIHNVYVNRCKYCGKNYSNEAALNVHISKIHAEDDELDTRKEDEADNSKSGDHINLTQEQWESLTGKKRKLSALDDENSGPSSPDIEGKYEKRGLTLTKKKRRDLTKHTCEFCGQTITGKQAMKNHVRRVHLKERNHKCHICPKGFWCKSLLESHMLSVHTRQCEKCKEYVVETEPWAEGVSMVTLRRVVCKCGHRVVVISKLGGKKVPEDEDDDDANMYQCGTCNKLFPTRAACEAHHAIHTEAHKCKICNKVFTANKSLVRHMNNVHSIQTNPCHVCKKSFANQKSLLTHLMKEHGQQGVMFLPGEQDTSGPTEGRPLVSDVPTTSSNSITPVSGILPAVSVNIESANLEVMFD
ncbi:zinc finger protein 420-like isoform X1 [Dreissena polymorpha]|nr:zinc finger protein 420-like isoform X1 [Dreissena polymorpha]XP_052267151.1 zinc finger protein 420-like isoform X1 [Dreissena polymorpha]